jgi:hypothetical protein
VILVEADTIFSVTIFVCVSFIFSEVSMAHSSLKFNTPISKTMGNMQDSQIGANVFEVPNVFWGDWNLEETGCVLKMTNLNQY